ncbi:hypothetical protein FRB95_004848 [Tulasnella sp. JGI-2019a]|nr:hypothetical protein FRB95_004848 [Tulasnella sp. JGI-2019a]
MKKLFGKKGHAALTTPTPLPPPSPVSTPATIAPAPLANMPQSKSLPMVPQSPAKRPSGPQAVFSHSVVLQQQRPPRQPDSRSTSGDDAQPPSEAQQKRDSTWVVVDNQQPSPPPQLQSQSQPQPQVNGGPDYTRGSAPPSSNHPAFESRSSLASAVPSLPPGASPPLAYPNDVPAPFIAIPPPQPPSSQAPTPSTVSRGSDPSRRHSQAGLLSYNGGMMDGSVDHAYEPSVASERDGREKHPEKPWKGLFGWGDKDKHRDRDRERGSEVHNHDGAYDTGLPDANEPRWDITRTVGYVTATGSEDWTLLLDVCERASTESGAKEAAKALRNEFKYAEPSPMLSAARLWAVMLRNCQAPFLQQSSSKKFIESVEDCVMSHNTSPVVRERLLLIIGGAAAQHGDQYPAFRALWRKMKGKNAPRDGIPFDPKDAMFSPPTRRLPKPGSLNDGVNGGRPHSVANLSLNVITGPVSPVDGPHVAPFQSIPFTDDSAAQLAVRRGSRDPEDADRELPRQRDPRKAGSGGRTMPQPPLQTRPSRGGIISPEEDMRRLFEECELARGNAQMLSNALVYARPEEVLKGTATVLIEFRTSCLRSKEIIETQIPWATAGADRSRLERGHKHRKENDSSPVSVTVEEELLAALLQANQDLTEALREYDDVVSIGAAEREEKEVKERSRKEIRLDRTQIQYYDPDGSFITEPQEGGGGSGPSRSPSPTKRPSPAGTGPHPLPIPPMGSAPHYIPPHLTPISHHHNGSTHTLAPPPPAPHGPRQPSSINGIDRSRSPSPDGGRRSIDINPKSIATPAAIERTASSGGRAMESIKRGLGTLGLDVHRSHSRNDKIKGVSLEKGKSRENNVSVADLVPEDRRSEDDVISTPIQPTAKALGKRKADPYAEDDNFDTDDLFKERPETPLGQDDGLLQSDSDSMIDDRFGSTGHSKPIVYAYDAAAEKEKERQRLTEMAMKPTSIQSIG